MQSLLSTREQGDSGSSRAHLYLNVYDLTHVNNYLYWFGFGVFHSGIEAHGMEYAFGAHEYSTSGVFEVEPKSCPGFTYRRSVWLGSTDMSPSEFRSFMEELSVNWKTDSWLGEPHCKIGLSLQLYSTRKNSSYNSRSCSRF
eukprot:TRINITY_DN27851_c0_g1_i3.p1 TRINITY_DN27851_c0_g1~~TRINITY_DN27851_c0_g1_i3.p1  ORF type:complete len:142 (-),score=16.64 TRINITY_DN27851_c0_g1_i3:320-745(-)